jgi:hypothetical protein
MRLTGLEYEHGARGTLGPSAVFAGYLDPSLCHQDNCPLAHPMLIH